MYPVSQDYINAVTANELYDRIKGTITLNDDTVIEIDDEDIEDGSLYYTEQITSGDELETGAVVMSELGLTLINSPENPYSLDGARIALQYGVEIAEGTFEYVPLGIFYVTEIKRNIDTVTLTAFDGMLLLDKDISGVITSGNARDLVLSLTARCGASLATTSAEFAEFANYSTMLTLPAASKVKTCRDLLMWIGMATATSARFDRQGKLELISITDGAPVRTIPADDRYIDNVSDNYVKITQVTMKIGENTYSAGVEGLTLELEENPLMIGKSNTQINTMLTNILNKVTLAEYTPASTDYIGDPALMAGDYVLLEDTASLDGEPTLMMITSSSWRYRGKHNLASAGKSAMLRSSYDQTGKAVSAVVGTANEALHLATSANNSTQLIKDTLGGNILLRQETGTTNEMLIMDAVNPDNAKKLWRWNLGGLGYSDNVIGADNPQRQYKVAMTMDGAITADFIKTGVLASKNNTSWIDMDNGSFNFGDGSLTFYGGKLKATGEIVAEKGAIGGFEISGHQIRSIWDTNRSSGMQIGTSGIWAFWAGADSLTAYANAPFRVSHVGKLYATDAVIQGDITADTGSIGGWNIENNVMYSKNGSTYTTLKSGGAIAFATGAPDPFDTTGSLFYVWHNGRVTALDAVIRGDITAEKGSIGGWSLTSNTINSKNGSTYTTLKKDGFVAFAAGSPSATDTTGSPFQIYHDGRIVAEKGSIGGWDINASAIYSKTGDTYSTMKIGGNVALAFGSPGITSTTGATTQFWHNGYFNLGDRSLTYYGGDIKMASSNTEVTFGTVNVSGYQSARGLRLRGNYGGSWGNYCDIVQLNNDLAIVTNGDLFVLKATNSTNIHSGSSGVSFYRNGTKYGVDGKVTVGGVPMTFVNGVLSRIG